MAIDTDVVNSLTGVRSSELAVTEPLVALAALAEDDLARGTLQVAMALAPPGCVRALFVIEVPSAVTDWMLTVVDIEQSLSDPVVRAREIRRLRASMQVDAYDVPFELAVGTASECILERAHRHRADLIVVGMRHHSVVGRLLGNDTARNLALADTVPVLAVHPPLVGRPHRIVVGMDFTRASMRAAALARRFAADDAVIHLVHVRGDEVAVRLERDEAEQQLRVRGAEALLEAVIRDLHPTTGMSITAAVVSGDPVENLLLACERDNADLLAIGSQRYRLRDRVRVGSVANALRHGASCSMLLTPPSPTKPSN